MKNKTQLIDPSLLLQLRNAGVETVKWEFDGSGDSGELFDPDIEPKNLVFSDVNALLHLGDKIIDCIRPGWEINEGSCGHFTLDVKTGKVAVHFGTKISDVEYEDFTVE